MSAVWLAGDRWHPTQSDCTLTWSSAVPPAEQMLLWSRDVVLFTDGEPLEATDLVGGGSVDAGGVHVSNWFMRFAAGKPLQAPGWEGTATLFVGRFVRPGLYRLFVSSVSGCVAWFRVCYAPPPLDSEIQVSACTWPACRSGSCWTRRGCE